MGLLDDAIREHLDLKRRRGADPTEVERLEHEALGPVRRGAYEPDEVALGPEYAHSTEHEAADHDWVDPADSPELFDQAPEYVAPEHVDHERVLHEPVDNEPMEHESLGHEPEPVDVEPARPTPRHHEIAEQWDEHEPLDLGAREDPDLAGDPFAADESFAAGRQPRDDSPPGSHEPVPAEPAVPADRAAQRTDHLDEATVEYDVEEAQRQEGAEAEDVLEETPEFLQDTPDHDRLWFEQRPPRDFDFDG